MFILSWEIEKMFNALNAIIDNNEGTLIECFGIDNWDRLVELSNGDKKEAVEWVKHVYKVNLNNTHQLLLEIKKLTKDNSNVQKILEAVGL